MAITGFVVGAEFKLIDQFSPTLRKLLGEIRQLNVALDLARASLAAIGKGVTAGLGGAVGETQALAVAWREVAAASALASRKTLGARRLLAVVLPRRRR
jgi:hypothetical protein